MFGLNASVLPHLLLPLFPAVFLAILFLQSGLDKAFDWKGNLSWLTGHFAKSPLRGTVPVLLGVITVIEISAGVTSALGAVFLVVQGTPTIAFWGAALSALALTSLFFGQRLAKDYDGAAGLVPYFLLTLAALYLCRGLAP